MWVEVICKNMEQHNKELKDLRNRIIDAQQSIKSRYEIVKRMPGRDLSFKSVCSTVQYDLESDKENNEPQIGSDEPTDQQVIDNNIIFKYIRDQKYEYFSERFYLV